MKNDPSGCVSNQTISKPNATAHTGLRWPPLIPGILIRRYKRFLADVRLENGETVIAHCPNSGSMATCATPGRPVYLSISDNPRRKLRYTWEMIQMPTSLVGVNTQVPNRLVAQAVAQGLVPELSGYTDVRREIRVGEHSRIDIGLAAPDRRPCYVEVKNCTWVENGLATFPDAVTLRGQKHLMELQALVKSGCRCVMFFLIQRMDADRFAPADNMDPEYGRKLREALHHHVEILVYDVHMDLYGICLNRKIALDKALIPDKTITRA
ncbi:DNA/RNA nuclease SfsA [Desulfosarcina sp. OttesenSCG-928-A07]|nr:DNA/RNA nuclease SfsA [Desulfosarcina sp. OttesenSCG-928-G17]MDL2330103.1 DNA/RNA nuclease SfsA [Desulfosarcina sp. OttesenSCG-928-A07]